MASSRVEAVSIGASAVPIMPSGASNVSAAASIRPVAELVMSPFSVDSVTGPRLLRMAPLTTMSGSPLVAVFDTTISVCPGSLVVVVTNWLVSVTLIVRLLA